jgi:thiamine pyrophosphate-dependent acetolactate synthase large subunit-like protein
MVVFKNDLVEPAIEKGLKHDGPALVQLCITSGLSMPPTITSEQARVQPVHAKSGS